MGNVNYVQATFPIEVLVVMVSALRDFPSATEFSRDAYATRHDSRVASRAHA